MKQCTTCKVEKSLEAFYKTSRTGAPSSKCKDCIKAYQAKRRQEDPERERARSRESRRKRIESGEQYENSRWYSIKYRYGISEGKYQSLLSQQNGACAICMRVPNADEWLVVDHDHKCCRGRSKGCGECVRGLLCSPCNKALGNMEDDVERFISAATYLMKDANVLEMINHG